MTATLHRTKPLSYTFYMFYTDKSNGQSKGEILSNQNHTSKGPTAWVVAKLVRPVLPHLRAVRWSAPTVGNGGRLAERGSPHHSAAKMAARLSITLATPQGAVGELLQ